MGHDVFYIPRGSDSNDDDIFGENPQTKFEKAYNVAMYLPNVEGYEGDNDFFSKFGLEIRDNSNFIISRREFEKYVPENSRERPQEGDLIYVPVLKKLFEIKFVEEEIMFFSLGKRDPYIYELRCELFRFSNENINTGVKEIDDISYGVSYSITLDVSGGTGNYYIGEIVYQGANISSATATAKVKNWYPSNTQIELINIAGSFTTGANLIGTNSGTTYNVSSQDSYDFFIDYDVINNKDIQTQGNTFIDFSEINPFGMP